MLLCTENTLFGVNLLQTIKTVCLRWNLVPTLTPLSEFGGNVHLSCFEREILFVGKFCPKIQNCLFKIKLGAEANSNMLNSVVMFRFSLLDQKYPFWTNLIQKGKIVRLRWNLVPRLIGICWIWWWSLCKAVWRKKIINGSKLILLQSL